jgi:hypothetical protein
MLGHFLQETSAISTDRSPSRFARFSEARNGCGLTRSKAQYCQLIDSVGTKPDMVERAMSISRSNQAMKIAKHSESHLVELDDGSKWQIFPGDLDVTLNWQPDTDLKLVRIEDEVSSHALVSAGDNSSVRVLPVGEKWPVKEVKRILKDG